jgi:hypothetical protein
MKAPDTVMVAAAFAIAVTFGLVRDFAYEHVSASNVASSPPAAETTEIKPAHRPKFVHASISQDRAGIQFRDGAAWDAGRTRGGSLPPSKDANPEQ